jgi:hypothetical protein
MEVILFGQDGRSKPRLLFPGGDLRLRGDGSRRRPNINISDLDSIFSKYRHVPSFSWWPVIGHPREKVRQAARLGAHGAELESEPTGNRCR